MSRNRDTVVVACHLYRVDEQKFKALCRVERKFHSEILRELILGWIDLKSNNLPEDLKSKGEDVKIFPDEKVVDKKIPDAKSVAETVKELMKKK